MFMHDESILREELRSCTEESSKTKKMELYHCVAKCCPCYNTLQNFGLHQILEPTLVLHIIVTTLKSIRCVFSKCFGPFCKKSKMSYFGMLSVAQCI